MKRILLYDSIFILLILPVLAGSGEIYKWVDGRGIIHLTDDFSRIPEAFRDRIQAIPVEETSERQVEIPEIPPKAVAPYIIPPKKPKAEPVQPPSGFIPFDKFKHLTEGMTEAEVLSRLGPPTREVADEMEIQGGFNKSGFSNRKVLLKRYYYIGNYDLGERTTVVHFRDGTVQKIERIFPRTR